jgi:uncharacterized membrane protein YcaP (DUF421 family)
MWHDMLVAGVPLAERVLRALGVYVFAVVALRIAGKRELGQLSTFDLVVLLFFSNILQNSIIGNDVSVTGGIVGAATLLAANHVVVRLLYRHRRLDELIEGRATYLVKDGVIQEHNLKRELVTREEVLTACHKQGMLAVEQVAQAVLEPDGSITVLAKLPSPQESAHQDVLRRLDTLGDAVRQLSARLDDDRGPAGRAARIARTAAEVHAS